jgi:hypothetical protein
MFNANLSKAVQDFAALVLPLSEKELEREWKWKVHDEEIGAKNIDNAAILATASSIANQTKEIGSLLD